MGNDIKGMVRLSSLHDEFMKMIESVPTEEWERREFISLELEKKGKEEQRKEFESKVKSSGLELSEVEFLKGGGVKFEFDIFTGKSKSMDNAGNMTEVDEFKKYSVESSSINESQFSDASFMLVGDYGTGKTLFCHALGLSYLYKGKVVQLVEDIEIKRDASEYERGDTAILKKYLDCDLLVLDDLLSREYRRTTIEFINEVTCFRIKKNRDTVFTSNKIPTRTKIIPKGEVESVPFISTRTFDRMRTAFFRVHLNGSSNRKNIILPADREI